MANKKRLIDANRLKAELRKSAEYHEKRRLGYYSAIDHIDEQPTVDAVEVVHGHWKYGTRAAVCSECGFERHLDDNYGRAIACPNCGAKMDGDGNG